MASALMRLGHKVHVITSTKDSERSFHDNGVLVHQVVRRKLIPNELQRLHYSYSVAQKISRINCRFDIVQSSEFAAEAFCFALKKKFPLVTRLATPFFLTVELNGNVFLRWRSFFNWMEKKQTLLSDGIFASTNALAKIVAERWKIDPIRVDVLPNSIDIDRVIRLGTKGSAPDIIKNKDFLLYFGRLEERKGVRVLAHALPAVFERFPSLNMVFIGSDPGYRGSTMKEYITKKSGKYMKQIIFLDNQPHERLFPIVNLAKIVILPSLWEAFGFVCVEAMALGRPVIATSGSGFEEIIEDNISGYLVEPGKSGLLANKIITVLKNDENSRRISEVALKRAQDFNVSKVAVSLLAYYKKIIKKDGI